MVVYHHIERTLCAEIREEGKPPHHDHRECFQFQSILGAPFQQTTEISFDLRVFSLWSIRAFIERVVETPRPTRGKYASRHSRRP